MPSYRQPFSASQFLGGSDGGGSSIADLIMANGRAQADSALRSGDIWQNAIGQATNAITTGLQDYKSRRDDSQVQKAVTSAAAPGADIRSIMSGLPPELQGRFQKGISDWQEFSAKRAESDARLQKLTQEIEETKRKHVQDDADKLAMGAHHVESLFDSPQGAVAGVNMLYSAAKADKLTDDRFDDFVSGINDAWSAAKGNPQNEAIFLDALKQQALPILQGLKQGASASVQEKFKPEVDKVTTRNADGSETIRTIEKKPGQVFTSAPEPPNYQHVETGAGIQPFNPKTGTLGAPIGTSKRDARLVQTDEERARLVEAVTQNPALWDDLTPSEKGHIAGDLNARGFTGFGKGLPEKAVANISASKSAVDSLRDLRGVLQENEQYIGPIAGLQAINPYSDARKAQAKIDLVRQRVGKALEGGVLRKEDEEKYKKILATLRDEPSTAIYKVDQLIKNVENDLGNYIEEQRRSGRRVNTDVSARPAQPAAGGPKQITSKADFDALPSGTEFIDPTGQKRRKP